MNWYKHDTNATQDAKVKKLLIKHGAVGYAIYFHCLELIAAEISESNLTFELEHDSEIIADNLHIKGTADKSGVAIVEEIMRTIIELKLFQESDGRVFCFKLLKRLDLSMTSNVKFREIISKAKEKMIESHDGIMMESCKIRLNKPDKINKTKKIAPAFAVDSMPYRMAKLIYDLHLGHDPKFLFGKNLEKTLQRWAKDIDKLNRLDGREWEEIERVIRWCQSDGCFWIPNILSGATLRGKFPVLIVQSAAVHETADEKRIRLCREEMAKV